eukprot:gene13250-15570_t
MYLRNFNFFCSLLRCGPIPKHIGVIMDGNRRFARRLNIETSQGHKLGFTKMLDLCQWGLALGVEIISVYAFSIENFKRPKKEVEDLMELANAKFNDMLSKSSTVQKMGVRIRVVGDISHIPETTRIILAKAVKSTASNNKLSDFMLWQSCFSSSNFLNVLWPDFSSIHFFYIIFLYQKNHHLVKELQKKKPEISNDRIKEFIDQVQRNEKELFETLANKDPSSSL